MNLIPVTKIQETAAVIPLLAIVRSKSMNRLLGRITKADEPLMCTSTAKFSGEFTGKE